MSTGEAPPDGRSRRNEPPAEPGDDLVRQLRAARKRLSRKLGAIEGDLERGKQAPELRKHAMLALCHLHELSPGDREITVLDESVEPAASVTLRFAPPLSPKRQIDAWFAKARKLERGVAIAGERAEACRRDLAALEGLLTKAEGATEAELEGLRAEAAKLGVRGVEPPDLTGKKAKAKARSARSESLPYREFEGSGGRAIRVGRGAEHNDRLTLEHCRMHDLWLHARDEAGAHVVVPLERGEACPPALLADAATLAAHFSKARGQGTADVAYTQRRFVRKPRGAKTGLVALLREKVLRVQLQPARLKRLLASERDRT
jgi:predicted ribosome quality control (RQC) complex YloA/Tae2 family protein